VAPLFAINLNHPFLTSNLHAGLNFNTYIEIRIVFYRGLSMDQKKSNSGFELRREDRKPIFDQKKVRASKSSMALLVGLSLSVGALSSCEDTSINPSSGETIASSSSEEPESGVLMPPVSSSVDSLPLTSSSFVPEVTAGVSSWIPESSSSYMPPSSSEPLAGSSVTNYPLESSSSQVPVSSSDMPLAGIAPPPSSSSEAKVSSSEPLAGDIIVTPIEPLSGSIIPYSSSEKVSSSSSEPISGDPIPLSSSEGSSSSYTPSMPTAGMPMVIDDDTTSGDDQGVL